MNIYNEIIEKGYLTESLAKLIFKDESTRKNSLKSYARTQTARKICIFYAALTQAYVIAKCIKDNCTLKEHKKFKSLANILSDVWTGKRDLAIGKVDQSAMTKEEKDAGKNIVFSFLNSCAKIEDGLLVKQISYKAPGAKETTLLTHLGEVYHAILFEGFPDSTSAETFVELIASLPLLSMTEVKGNKLVFNVNGETLETKCSPYFFFAKGEGYNGFVGEEITQNCMVLTSVLKGEQDNELRFVLMDINSADTDPEPKVKTLKVKGREDIRFACKTVGIETQWYKEEYWCDFKYIKRLAEATCSSILDAIDGRDREDVLPKVKPLFARTDLHAIVSAEEKLFYEDVEGYIYKLFITQGIFKTVRCLLSEPERGNNGQGNSLFEAIMRNLVAASGGDFTDASRKEIEEECEEQILTHENKLARVVRRGSKAYRLRMIEVKAEQRALSVVKAAGLQSENLVEDEESLIAIDDYFDMIKNPEHKLVTDLKHLLRRLYSFYGALLRNGQGVSEEAYKFDEEKYYRDLREINAELGRDVSIEELFDRLIETGQRSQNHPVVAKLLGREKLFDDKRMEGYKKHITKNLDRENEWRQEGKNIESPTYGRKVFISYAREDNRDGKITRFAEACREEGIEVFFDKDDIETCDEWYKSKILKTISSEDCCAVCVFVSETSMKKDFTSREFMKAVQTANARFPRRESVEMKEQNARNEQRRRSFIIPVNLAQEEIKSIYNRLIVDETVETEYVERFYEIVKTDYIQLSRWDDIRSDEKWKTLKNCFVKASRWINEDWEVDEDERYKERKEYSRLEVDVANFFAYLKYGEEWGYIDDFDALEKEFGNPERDTSKCIFPMVASVKETRVKRDNIAVIGYEIINGAGRENKKSNYILTSKRLNVDEYYCIPNYKTSGDRCSWMVEPLLINYKKFSEEYPEEL